MSDEQREVARAIAAGPRGEVRGPFIALLHHPALARHLQGLGEQLRWKSPLPAHLVELAVLITARRWTCQHEWFMHQPLARKAGLDGAVELLVLCGYYTMMAMVLNTAGLPLPDDAAPPLK